MSKLISTVIGFLLAVAAFMAIQKLIPSITKNIFAAGFVFIVLFGGGICLSYIAWWLAVIIGIIALIIYAVKKKKPLKIKDEDLIMDSSAAIPAEKGFNPEESNEL